WPGAPPRRNPTAKNRFLRIDLRTRGLSMKVREAMTSNPACCVPGDSAQKVAAMLRDQDVGSIPVVVDQQSRKLLGIITDRDLCLKIVAEGLNPKSTPIERSITLNPVVCREGENLDNCERQMQEHQVRRIPVVDAENRCIGIVSQADLALREKPEKISKTVAEISKPARRAPSIAASRDRKERRRISRFRIETVFG